MPVLKCRAVGFFLGIAPISEPLQGLIALTSKIIPLLPEHLDLSIERLNSIGEFFCPAIEFGIRPFQLSPTWLGLFPLARFRLRGCNLGCILFKGSRLLRFRSLPPFARCSEVLSSRSF
ncbi:MAG: hypothetical protein DI606_15985 [Sphingobium sp.]|nr:MAG: hypothetical protein DI606_15985 [Sphingobium sp.]